jgi:hypothetical protein
MASTKQRLSARASAEFGNFICEILHKVYVDHRDQFEKMARQEGVAIESIAAAALAQGISETYLITERG